MKTNYPKASRAPSTIRYCQRCERTTTFEYDPNILHSRCCVCGGTFSSKDKESYEAFKKTLEKRKEKR